MSLKRNVTVTSTLDVLILSIRITIMPFSKFNHEPYLPVIGSRRIIVTNFYNVLNLIRWNNILPFSNIQS